MSSFSRGLAVLTAAMYWAALQSTMLAATVVVDDNFDDGDLATNTGGVGMGFIGHAQDQLDAGPPFVASVYEAGGYAFLETDPDNGFSLGSLVSKDTLTLNPAGHLIEYFYFDLHGIYNMIGVVDQSYDPGPSNGGMPFHPAFEPPGALFADADVAGLVDGAVSLFITDTTFSINGGTPEAHTLGAATVRFGVSYQGPVENGFPSASVLERIRVTAMSTAAVPGDFNGDGNVDGADFVIWQTNFPNNSGTGTLAMGDANGDGNIDGADFVVWQTNFPFTPVASATPVPEPQALCLLVVGAACALTVRARVRR